MRVAPIVKLTDDQREELEGWARGRSVEHRLVMRAKIVLLAAAGKKNQEIMAELRLSAPTVQRWRDRFVESGIEGIASDAPRSGRPRVIGPEKVKEVVEATMNSRPADATHWSTRTMAQAQGISKDTIRRIWHQHQLQPHRVETFKFSKDPKFFEKLEDVVGLYMNPPDKALVFSFDEKSQIQALDRTQLLLPIRPGIPARQTHDYKRNGTTTLFAALNVLEGTVISDCMKRHRHQEFLKFLNKLDQQTPADQELHLIMDNYATHKHAKVENWLTRHKRFHFHFVPTSSSWLNIVERFFSEITEKRIRRGTFKSVPDLIQAIDDYIKSHNKEPKAFVWTASAERIKAKIAKLKEIYAPGH
ncbi:MAG TPA: IS630 family transposase [Candidatus Obscuribacterales bacterium]